MASNGTDSTAVASTRTSQRRQVTSEIIDPPASADDPTTLLPDPPEDTTSEATVPASPTTSDDPIPTAPPLSSSNPPSPSRSSRTRIPSTSPQPNTTNDDVTTDPPQSNTPPPDTSEDAPVVTQTSTVIRQTTIPPTTVVVIATPTTPNAPPVTLTSVVSIIEVTSFETISRAEQPTEATDPALNTSASSSSGKSGFFNNTGAVAGTFLVVGLVAVAMLVGAIMFYMRRKRARALDEDLRQAAVGAGGATSRFEDDDDMDYGDGSAQENVMSQYSHGNGGYYIPSSNYSHHAPVMTNPTNSIGASSAGHGNYVNNRRSFPTQAAYDNRFSTASMYTSDPFAEPPSAGAGATFDQQAHYQGAQGQAYSDWNEYFNAYGGAHQGNSSGGHSQESAGHSGESDERLNQDLMRHPEANNSAASLKDEADYSRRILKVANN